MLAHCQESGPRIKTSRSHLKILAKLTKIFGDDSIWQPATLYKIARLMYVLAHHQDLDLQIKTSHSHLKLLATKMQQGAFCTENAQTS
jgi:hypothetical protein